MILLLLHAVIATAFGWMLVNWCLFEPDRQRQSLSIQLPLAIGIGYGIGSLILLGTAFIVGGTSRLVVWCELSFLLIAAVLIFVFGGDNTSERVAQKQAGGRNASTLRSRPTSIQSRWLLGFLCLTLIFGMITFIAATKSRPHGRWDAWLIWNRRARFLLADGKRWQTALTSPVAAGGHPDYPLLLPLTVARGWRSLGDRLPLLSQSVAAAYALGAVLLLGGVVGRLRNTSLGLIASIALASTAFWWQQASWQYADVPLAFYCLAGVGCLVMGDIHHSLHGRKFVLAGVCFGLAAWTKNEGILWALAAVVATLCVSGRGRTGGASRRDAAWLLAGLTPILTAVLIYKLCFAATNDLIAGQSLSATSARLLDPIRYRAWLSALVTYAPQLCGALGIMLLALSATQGFRRKPWRKQALARIALLLVVVFLGYQLVFLTTPQDLPWHLATAYLRTLLHLWPSALLLYFSSLSTIESTTVRRTSVTHERETLG